MVSIRVKRYANAIETLQGLISPSGRFKVEGLGLRTRSRPIQLLVVTSFLLAVVVAAGMAFLLFSLRDRAIRESDRELKTTALVLAAQSNASFQALELVQRSLIDHVHALGITSSEAYEEEMSGNDVHLMLKDKMGSLPHVDAVTLINAEGKLFNYSRQWPVGVLSIADRQFFKSLKADPKMMTIISEPLLNRTTGTWTVYLARKVVTRDGELIGLVLGAMPLDYFEEFYKRIVSGPHDSIALFRDDGLLLARHPNVEDSVGKTFPNGAFLADRLNGAEKAPDRRIGVIDGKERLVAFSKLPNFPVYVTVSTTIDNIFSNWLSETMYLLGLGIALIFGIGGTCIAVVHRVRQQGALLDTALNNMPFGIVMFDRDGRLAVVNDSFLQMYGLTQEAVRPGRSAKAILDERTKAGNFAGDPDAYLARIKSRVDIGEADVRTIETPDGRSIQVTTRPMRDGAFVNIHDDITERRRAEKRIAHMAHHDALTGLPNRVAFTTHLEAALERAGNLTNQAAVLSVDFDRFKEINDLFGHSTGDAVLREVSKRMAEAADGAFLARIGGDEMVLISEGPQPDCATALAERLQLAVAKDLLVDGQLIRPGLSIGVAIFPADGDDAKSLLANADAALYRAKNEGRCQTKFFEPEMDQQLRDRRALLHDLRIAVEGDQLFLNYQPQATIDGEIIGFEALVRWKHPERGLIPPNEFISIAESNGLIQGIGEWVLREACKEAASWQRPLQIAVNLSPMQFRDGELVDQVHQILFETGLHPTRLELEITEGVLMEDFPRAVSLLRRLKNLGVRIAMDDFGTGYSSLSYLQSFPFDKIKVDRSFIRDVDRNSQSAAIVRLIIALARGLAIPVMAEGVETIGQRDLLRAEDCNEMQGFLIGRPLHINLYEDLIGSAVQSRAKAAVQS